MSLSSRVLLACSTLALLLLTVALAGWLATWVSSTRLADMHEVIMALGGVGVGVVAGLVLGLTLAQALRPAGTPADSVEEACAGAPGAAPAGADAGSTLVDQAQTPAADAPDPDPDMLRLQQAVAAMQASFHDVMRGMHDWRAAPRVHQLATAAGPLTLVSAEPSLRIDQAVDAAQRSAEVVSQVVGKLEEIASASRRILDTVKLIDSIAFQTNLLALNAAVEAARAGDQGRAARVAAADVRMLAQRAATAAREIKSLMGDTLHKLEAGGRGLRGGSHTTMDAILTSVQCVTDIVGHIQQTPAAAGSVAETVEISIEQLDQMTRQNIALVQQSAGAAESLRVQAERLQKVVSAFKLLQHTQEAAWTAHSAISGARRSARLGGADAGSGSD
jgi:hypothetical protein